MLNPTWYTASVAPETEVTPRIRSILNRDTIVSTTGQRALVPNAEHLTVEDELAMDRRYGRSQTIDRGETAYWDVTEDTVVRPQQPDPEGR